MTGKTISHYKILEKLGKGGMGVVSKPRTPSSSPTGTIRHQKAQSGGSVRRGQS